MNFEKRLNYCSFELNINHALKKSGNTGVIFVLLLIYCHDIYVNRVEIFIHLAKKFIGHPISFK